MAGFISERVAGFKLEGLAGFVGIRMMLKPGQVLYDNDPRYRGRKVDVVRIEGSYAICTSGPRQVKVRLDRIFSDGKARRSGYSTVAQIDRAPDPAPPPAVVA